ncbi:MAG: hypothetical protein EOO92_14215 [Pedobacter sp.]|nr:MAG: hypothetical protein EOO92_14215 [Pedobacter sp.]
MHQMKELNQIIESLEFAQIGWVVPNIYVSVNFLSTALNIKFPEPVHMNAIDLSMKYKGQLLPGEWLTTQTFNGGTFIELVQPISGESMFHDYLAQNPLGGVQHLAYRLPVSEFENITNSLLEKDYQMISNVDHPIARMAFFDTYETLGVATEIMGVTPEGWDAIESMKTGM